MDVAQHVQSVDTFSKLLIERLYEPSVLDKFCTDHLRHTCLALGLPYEASHRRRTLIQMLLIRRKEERHKPAETIQDFFI